MYLCYQYIFRTFICASALLLSGFILHSAQQIEKKLSPVAHRNPLNRLTQWQASSLTFGRCKFIFRPGHQFFSLRAFVLFIGTSRQIRGQCFHCGNRSFFSVLNSWSLTHYPATQRSIVWNTDIKKNHKVKHKTDITNCTQNIFGFISDASSYFGLVVLTS